MDTNIAEITELEAARVRGSERLLSDSEGDDVIKGLEVVIVAISVGADDGNASCVVSAVTEDMLEVSAVTMVARSEVEGTLSAAVNEVSPAVIDDDGKTTGFGIVVDARSDRTEETGIPVLNAPEVERSGREDRSGGNGVSETATPDFV